MTSNVQNTDARQFVTQQTHYYVTKVVAADLGNQVPIGYRPRGSIITAVSAAVGTAFDGTTPNITVGTSADPDAFAATLDVSAVGTKRDATTLDATAAVISPTTQTNEDLLVAALGGTGVTAGVAYVIVEFVYDVAVDA